MLNVRRFVRVAAIAIGLSAAASFAQSPAATPPDAPVFREPFTMKLPVDDKHYYEQQFGKIPYVATGDVYLFNGESFGINITTDGDRITSITYQPDAAKADVQFSFRQEKSHSGLMTLLTTQNKTKHKLFFDALMTVPDKKAIMKTSVLPIEPGLTNFESWPHPILQLVLRNFRFTADTPTPH